MKKQLLFLPELQGAKAGSRYLYRAIFLLASVFVLGMAGNVYSATINVPGDHATIQAAVTAATAGDVITVAAGTYTENVLINKTVELRGANYGMSASTETLRSARGAETIINGAFSIGNVSNIANNVVIDGFKFIGSAVTFTDRTKIAVIQGTNAKIQNNIFDSELAASTSFQVSGSGTFGITIGGGYNQTGLEVKNNYFVRLRSGVFSNPNLSTAQLYSNNQFSSRTGINFDHYGTSPYYATVSNNNFVEVTVGSDVVGPVTAINCTALFANSNVQFTGNVIVSNFVGIDFKDIKSNATVNLSNNAFGKRPSASGVTHHLWVRLNASTSVTINNNSFVDMVGGAAITNAGASQINAECNWYGTASNATSNISGTVDSNPWLVSGTDNEPATTGFQPEADVCTGTPVVIASATKTTDAVCNADAEITVTFSGGTGPYDIAWTGGSATGVTSPYVITGLTPSTYTATVTDANGSTAGSAAVIIANFSVRNENTGVGYSTIQAAVNAASANDILVVCAGTYNEDVNVNKDVDLRGANYGVCYDDEDRDAESIIAGLVTVSASGASLDGFLLTKRSTSTTSNGINFSNWSGVSLNVTGVDTEIRNNIIEMYGGAGGTDNAVILNAAGAVTFECNEVIGGDGYSAEDDGRGVSALRLTNTASDYSISGNHFGVSSGRVAGGDADAVSFFNVGDVDFDGNLVDGNIMGGVVMFGAVDDVTISNNTIKDYTAALAGIRVFNCCGYNSATADVTIIGNFVQGTAGTTGIAFRNDPIPAGDILDLSSNSITGNTTAIDFDGTGTLDATCNWYGTTDVTTIAASLSGSIAYQPFLSSGVDAAPLTAGFQPSPGSQPGYVTAVTGNGQPISNGSTTYSATNLTLMGSAPVGGSIVRNYSFTSATSCGATNGVTFTSLTFTGAGAARFSFGGVLTGTEYAPGTLNFTITYTAHTAEIEDEVTCVMATSSGAYTFGLKAVTTPALPAVAQISGNSVLISNGDFSPNTSDHTDFGSIADPGTLTRTYTITNGGPTGCEALEVDGISFVGGDAAKFSATGNTCSGSLASGASCTFTVTYTSGPTGGVHSTMIRVANSDPARDPYEYSIRAQLQSPDLSVTGNNTAIPNGDNTPAAADHTLMGSLVAGQTITRSYTLKNLGLGNLIIGAGAVALSAADNGAGHTNFAVTTPPAAGVYTTNEETYFSLTYTSPGQGQFYALVTLTTGNAGTFTFVVQGNGPTPRMQVVGNSVEVLHQATTVATANYTDFGTRSLNSGLIRQFTVNNPGSLGAAAPLILSGSPRAVVSGPGAAMFTVTIQPGSPVGVNGSTLFRIRYLPTAAGCHWAQISIASNDPQRNPYTFVVRGNTTGQSCGAEYPSLSQEEVIDRMEESDMSSELMVYPNPATDRVLLEVPASEESRIISFINVSGVTVYSIDTKGGFHNIDLAGFAPGVYNVVSSDRSLAPKRFIKL